MMIGAANFLAYSAQLGVLIVACAGLPWLLRLSAPTVQHAFWRTLLAVCLALPLIQPWRPATTTRSSSAFHAVAGAGSSLVSGVRSGPGVPSAVPYDHVAAARNVLVAGICVRLAWLSIGLLRLRRMRRRATDHAPGFEDLQNTIGVSAPILWSADVRHPVAFGLFRPVVLLPAALKAVDPAAQRAVVAHELHHVKRRDWAWLVAEEIVRSIFWFHPAMWWLVSRVQLARETVVDELSILVTNARRTYMDALLAFSDDPGIATPAFSARRHLFHRVMLLSQEGDMSSTRVAIGSIALVVALGAGSIGAVSAFPLHGAPRASQDKPDEDMQKLLASLKTALAEMERTAPERGALLRRLEQTSERITQLAADLERLQPPSEAKQRGMPPPPPPPVTAEYARLMKERQPVRITADMQAPKKVVDVPVLYPPAAREKKIEGVVLVEVIVDTAGKVAGAQIARSVTPELDKAALTAARSWKFEPYVVDGTPRNAAVQVAVAFRLR